MNQAMQILESLTPMGSEYHDDPERCAEYIREEIESGRNAKKELVRAQRKIKELVEKNTGLMESWTDLLERSRSITDDESAFVRQMILSKAVSETPKF